MKELSNQSGGSGSVAVRLIAGDDPRSGKFREFASSLVDLAPGVRVDRRRDASLPAILIGRSWRYHLVPGGAELAPFLDLLERAGKSPPAPGNGSLKGRVDAYASNDCPHCAATIRRILPLPFSQPGIEVAVIDPVMFPELAEGRDIRSVPVVICNDTFRWTGAAPIEEILDAVEHADEPWRLGAAVLRRMIEERSTGRLSEMMIAAGRVFPAFLELLVHPDFSVRLGAMAVMERIGERDDELAASALDPLWRASAGLDSPVRGDVIYLIGEFGHREWLAPLEALLGENPPPDLKEAVEEAIEKLAG